jgi:hypothetical protein
MGCTAVLGGSTYHLIAVHDKGDCNELITMRLPAGAYHWGHPCS